MLDLSAADRRTDAYHRRFIDEGLPASLAEAAAAFDPRGYSVDELARGRRAWQARVLDEHRSHVGFIHLLSDLATIAAPHDLLGVATRVVSDEARHTELCRRVVLALGGGDVLPGEPRHVRADPRLPPVVRVLHQVTGSLCVGETLSVRMLAAVRAETQDPLAREVMTVLVHDESIHGRFGWAVLEHLLPSLEDRALAALGAWLPRFLLAAEQAFCGGPTLASGPAAGDDGDLLVAGPAMPFGALSAKARRAVFEDALFRDVLARFDALGLEGTAAWSLAHREPAVQSAA